MIKILTQKKETLEKQILDIKLQLLQNRNLELGEAKGFNVQPKGEEWIVKARMALLIKKSQLKKINKQIKNLEDKKSARI